MSCGIIWLTHLLPPTPTPTPTPTPAPNQTDKPEYLAARAALRGAAGYPNPKGAHPKKRPDPDGAAGLAASFGEPPRA